MRGILAILIILEVFGFGNNIFAQSHKQVEELAKRALNEYDSGRYEEALRLYREAHSIMPLAKLSFAESRCLEALNRYDEALSVLTRALKENPDKDLKKRIEQRINFYKEKLKFGRLVLMVSPLGAEVTIDDRVVGKAPISPMDISPGVHKISVKYPGFAQVTQTVEVKGGVDTKLEITLSRQVGTLVLNIQPDGADVFVDGVARGLSPVGPIELESGTHQIEVKMSGADPVTRTVSILPGEVKTLDIRLGGVYQTPSVVVLHKARWYQNTWGWVLCGIGVVSVAAGSTLLALGHSDRKDVESLVARKDITGPSQEDLKSKWDSARTKETSGLILTGVGGAALLSGVIIFAVNPSARAELYNQSLVVSPNMGNQIGFTMMGRF